ncbi:MAG: hypothetical protein K2L25_03855 [Alphaproteobacteria bacterium]|nr:hypothetical protein [Alphaproteobacteria bacterium]
MSNKNKNVYHAFIAFYMLLSGLSTGGALAILRNNSIKDLDSDTALSLILYAGAAIYCFHRAQQVYKDKIQNQK